MATGSEMDDLEKRAARGSRASAALAAAASIIAEEHESSLRHSIAKHEGGQMTHDDYVRALERLTTLRRLQSNLERHQSDGERAREQMTEG